MKIQTFAEAEAALRPFYSNAATPYRLDTMRQLMSFLGNPQDKLRVIHVAGTSGKTSTAYYVASLLESTGATVGLTVSPHVETLNERVQINHQPLPEALFGQRLDEFLELVKRSGCRPSYFEVMIGLAYWVFARQAVDYAVIEVGLGGLLDGTNVISRADKVCLITDIGLDHTEILGDTLAKIAAQKAGIILPGNHVFMYRQGAAVRKAVKRQIDKQGATLQELGQTDQIVLPDLPLFQQRNLGLAVRAVDYVLRRDGQPPLTPLVIKRAAKRQIPARFERFAVDGGVVIVDGSHNSQKVEALLASVTALYPSQKPIALVAFVAGRDSRWQEAVKVMLPRVQSLVITGFTAAQDVPKQSVDPSLIADFCRQQGFTDVQVADDPAVAWQQLRSQPGNVKLVTGSFYLLNHLRPLIVNS